VLGLFPLVLGDEDAQPGVQQKLAASLAQKLAD
jgi:hypothetical protein